MRSSSEPSRSRAEYNSLRNRSTTSGSLSVTATIKSPALTRDPSTTCQRTTRPSTGEDRVCCRSIGVNAMTRPLPEMLCCHGSIARPPASSRKQNSMPYATARADVGTRS